MNASPVLKFWGLLQELQAWVGQQDASHHGLQVVLLHMLCTLLAQDVKEPHHTVRLRQLRLSLSEHKACTRPHMGLSPSRILYGQSTSLSMVAGA